MKNNLWIAALLAFILFSCSQKPMEEQGSTNGGNHKVILTRAQIQNAGIQFGQIEKQLLSSDVSARGEIMVPPQMRADIVSILPGTVKDIFVSLGDQVQAGQIMVTIQSQDFLDLQQDFIMAGNRLALLQQDYERQKTLKEGNAASEKKFQEAEALYLDARAVRNTFSERLKMIGVNPDDVTRGNISGLIKVKSPISGIVDEVNLNTGRYIEPADVLFRVLNTGKLLLEIMVFEKDILKVKPGQRVTFHLSNSDSDEYEAFVRSIASSVRTGAKVVRVHAGFENKGLELLPGMFVSAMLHTSEDSLDALPSEAILFNGRDQHFVYYSLPEWENDTTVSFMELPVSTGFEEDGYTQVKLLQQVTDHARFVVKGAYYVKSERMRSEE